MVHTSTRLSGNCWFDLGTFWSTRRSPRERPPLGSQRQPLCSVFELASYISSVIADLR